MSVVTIQTELEKILQQYVKARTTELFTNHRLRETFKEIAALLSASEPIQRRRHLRVQVSIGQGAWANVPWIALLDERETKTTRSGVYCVYLFRKDMSGVYLALNQGVTLITREQGRLEAHRTLRARAQVLRQSSPTLGQEGFSLQDTIDLETDGGLGTDYEASVVAHKLYAVSKVPEDATLLKDLDAILNAYDQYLQSMLLKSEGVSAPKNIAQMSQDENLVQDILPNFLENTSDKKVGLRTTQPFVMRFIASLLTKRFLILTGLAGSGKTKLAQAFARWITPTEDASPYYALVPVGADWTGNENIVGYPDGLDSTAYSTRPALELMRHALEPAHAQVPHFLILDEMNLSHVERYFADLLSAIESGEPIPLYDGDQRKAGQHDVPQRLRLPDNLFIIGTVNVDETTYMFSPKVLDRANVIEFRMEPAELMAFLDAPKATRLGQLDGKGQRFGGSFVAAAADRAREVPSAIKAEYQQEMLLFFNLLREHNAEFGYRTGYEAARFLHFYQLLGGYAETDTAWFKAAMDAVIVQKLLPKLHGSRSRLEGLLWALGWACGEEHAGRYGKPFAAQLHEASTAQNEAIYSPGVVEATLQKEGKEPRYPLSFAKIVRMWHKLVREQFVSFAEA